MAVLSYKVCTLRTTPPQMSLLGSLGSLCVVCIQSQGLTGNLLVNSRVNMALLKPHFSKY